MKNLLCRNRDNNFIRLVGLSLLVLGYTSSLSYAMPYYTLRVPFYSYSYKGLPFGLLNAITAMSWFQLHVSPFYNLYHENDPQTIKLLNHLCVLYFGNSCE